jgi:hypothetical protein
MKSSKNHLLKKGIVFDLIGLSTMFIPFPGMLIDLLWAPYAAKQMTKMYPGRKGKIASVIVFIEEILPGLDFIPTFTLMWVYTFIWKKQEAPILKAVKVNK